MKILVFGGSGNIGAAVAWDLVRREEVREVGLVGRHEEGLKNVSDWTGNSKIMIHKLNVLDSKATADVMSKYDMGVSTLPDRKTSYALLNTAIKAGFDLVDVLEEYHRRPDPYEKEGLQIPDGMTLNEYGDHLHERAIKNKVTFLDGIGFAPCISNIMVGEGIRKLDEAESAVARVGGIPSKSAASRHPLKYMITWSFDHVLREYMVELNVLKGGKEVSVEAGTELEGFRFNKFGIDVEPECAVTPGMPSIMYTQHGLQEFAEKTIRWPGHWQGIQTLKETGMLDLEPIEIKGKMISPREFLLAVLESKLIPHKDDTDVCVMWNTVTGRKNGKLYSVDSYLWDEADIDNDISSMARVTGFSAAIGAVLTGRGEIKNKGIVPPEECFKGKTYQSFMEEINKHGINIMESIGENDD